MESANISRGWQVFESSNAEPSSDSLDSKPSNTTYDLYDELQDSTERLRAATLPLLPAHTEKNPSSVTSRKRDRDECLASSSDAPLFSSDDLLAASSDLYIDEHRDKRLHRGTWYDEERGLKIIKVERSPRKMSKPRGPFQRSFDSGIWLGSDESMGSEEPEAEADRDVAVRKALRVMEMGGSIDDDEELHPGELNHDSNQLSEDEGHATLVHKAMQTTKDPENVYGPVFPYWYVVMKVTLFLAKNLGLKP
ncbi:hypothetical protein N7G274_009343 [Stereocaulon virgatum]|uniref:Uncharacterized protein n=1 Tax=Stereocaulon virgatum TaxID=373712 RepID=A0ABR4A3G3_9LECA